MVLGQPGQIVCKSPSPVFTGVCGSTFFFQLWDSWSLIEKSPISSCSVSKKPGLQWCRPLAPAYACTEEWDTEAHPHWGALVFSEQIDPEGPRP
jgi:hypothetical protein